MRIKIKEPRKLFDRIEDKNKISLKKLCAKLNMNYSSAKKYRRGSLLFPEKIFKDLIKLTDNPEHWGGNCIKFDDSWGASKAGKIASSKPDRKKILEKARSFKKISKTNIKINNVFCEFYGALLGDGCISKFKDYDGIERYVIQISGNKKLDSDYLKYIKANIKKEYGIYSYYYEYKNRNVCVLMIKNKDLALKLNKDYKLPIGKKYGNLQIPKTINDKAWNIKKYVIRGLFDTDGSIYAKKSENYKYPIISISSKDNMFLDQINKILRKQKYPSYISSSNVCIRGINNIKKWFNDIGSSNKRNKKKYAYFLKYKKIPPNKGL